MPAPVTTKSKVGAVSVKASRSPVAATLAGTASRNSFVTKIPVKLGPSTIEGMGGILTPTSLRRDFNLIRLILLEAEQPGARPFTFEGFDREMVQRHQTLVLEDGLVHGTTLRDANGSTQVLIDRLTWTGHDFVALIKDNARWKKAQTEVLDSQGRGHFDVVVDWLKSHR